MEVIPQERYGFVQGIFFGAAQILVLGAAYVGVATSESSSGGTSDWRYGLAGFAFFGLVVAILVALVMKDPVNERNDNRSVPFTWRDELQRVTKYSRNVMVIVLVLVGIFSSAPVCISSYLTLYLQYMGLSDRTVGDVLVVTGFFAPFANIWGGWLSDRLEIKYPFRGRVYAGMISVGFGAIFSVWLLLEPVSSYYVYVVIIAQSLVQLFNYSTVPVNHALLGIVVDANDRGVVFAWLGTLEALSSGVIFYPILAALSRAGGYVPSRETIDNTPVEQRMSNAHALVSAMLPLVVIGWGMNFLLYVGALREFPKTMQRRQEELAS